jgi:hypothetical protein
VTRTGTVSTGDFALPLPDGWSDRTAVTLAGPVGETGFVPNVVVTREALCSGLGLAGFADGQLRLLRDQAQEVSVLSTDEIRLGGARALLRTVRFRVGDGPALMQLQAFVVGNDTGYAITGTTGADGFAAAEPQLREVVEGFRFAEQAVPA